MTKRFENRFELLKSKKEGAFVPFVTLCDPNYETSYEILKTLITSGADALELGFPFSDPCADGPVIQKANKRSLKAGTTTNDLFRLISNVRKLDKDIPISILVYSNIVVCRGIDKFFADASAAGIDAVLIPDVPINMLHTLDDFEKCAKAHDINTILIAPPNASENTLEAIARHSSGYTYVLSRFGITGTENTFGKPVKVIARLKELKGSHTLLGFGISTPEHVAQALAIGAEGAIAGSACVKIVEQYQSDVPSMLKKLGDYVKSMKQATLNRN